MLIPITLSTPSAANPKLPPCLAKISHDEVVLIELQGSLEVESNHPSEQDGKHVGRLKIDEATNKPTLAIGHHLLEGKIQALPKPLAVIVRTSKPRYPSASSSASKIGPRNEHNRESEGDADDDMSMLVDEDDNNVPDLSRSEKFWDRDLGDEGKQSGSNEGRQEATETKWAVVAVVRKKIIFSKRPMPIVNLNKDTK